MRYYKGVSAGQLCIRGPGSAPLGAWACSSLNEGVESMSCLQCSFVGLVRQKEAREIDGPVESRHLAGCPRPPSSHDLGPGPETAPDTSILGPGRWGTSLRRDQGLRPPSLCLASLL